MRHAGRIRTMKDKEALQQEIQDKTAEEAGASVPFIHLEPDDEGNWRYTSNLVNPERVLRILGAQLVLRMDT